MLEKDEFQVAINFLVKAKNRNEAENFALGRAAIWFCEDEKKNADGTFVNGTLLFYTHLNEREFEIKRRNVVDIAGVEPVAS